MRIRKLAKELGVDQELLLALASKLGPNSYSDADQQLSKDAVDRLKIEVRKGHLNRGSLGITTGNIGVPRSDFLPKAPSRAPLLPDERDALKLAFSGVKPIEAPPSSKPTRKSETRPAAKIPEPTAPAPVAAAIFESRRPEPVKSPPITPPALQTAELLVQIQSLKAQLLAMSDQKDELEKKYRELLTSTSGMGAQLARALAGRDEAVEKAQTIEATWADRLSRMSQALDEARGTARQASSLTPLTQIFEERGLKGEDEHRAVLVGLLESRRAGPMLSRLVVEDAEPVRELLREKVMLLAEGDEEPAGAVAVRVSAERSEGEPASAINTAIRRFNTACLVYNKKRIVIVGGWPAAHARLKEGLDSRLNVRLLPGDRRGLVDVPMSDVTVLWASTILDHAVSEKFEDAIVIPHRGLSRMLLALVEHIEGKTLR